LVAPRPVDPLHFYAAFKLSTGEVGRRYEHDQPDAMIHVDVKKLGNIPTAPSTASSAASGVSRKWVCSLRYDQA